MSPQEALAKSAAARKTLEGLKAKLLKVENDIALAKKPKSKYTDAQIKSLNEMVKKLNSDISKAQNDVKNWDSVSKSLTKIADIDKTITKLYNMYNQAIARGEDTKSIEKNLDATIKQRGAIQNSGTPGLGAATPKLPIPFNWKTAKLTTPKKTTTPTTVTTKPSTTATTPSTTTPSTTATTAADTSAVNAKVYRGDGTKNSPLLEDGKPFTGTYAGNKYENGILIGKAAESPDTVETTVTTSTTKTKKTLTELLKQTEFWYDLPDYIFNLDTELGDLLVKAVDEGWDNDKFESQLKLTKWVQKNSENLRKRIIARAKYNELRAAGEDVANTEYAQDTASLRRSVQDRARRMGAALTAEQLDQVVGKIYDGFLDKDTNAIDRFIAPYIGKITSIVGTGLGTGGGQATYTGEALTNYQELQRIAKSNGLKLEDILPKLSVPQGSTLENVILQKLATGELDANAIAQTARQFAAQGQPDYVRNLLNQGYDLEQVYAPYRNIMASTLEVDSDQIDLNDPTLRGAITNEGDMNIYDFKKLLRKDSRWDTTENARQEVSSAVYSILRDFGFQG